MELENNWVSFTITRGPIRGKDKDRVGLIVHVVARPDVEAFMQGMSKGKKMPVDAFADSWQNGNPNGGTLEVYETAEVKWENTNVYTLNNIAESPLITPFDAKAAARGLPQPNAQELVNLSFLRLAGISDESGVRVGILGAYSNEYLNRLKLALPRAIKQFLQDYIVPVTLNLQVISKSN